MPPKTFFMKKIAFLLVLISLLSITNQNKTYGFSIIVPTLNSPQKASKSLSINTIVNLSAKEYSKLTGKKMNIWDKVTFNVVKIKMKHDLKKNPNLTLEDYTSKDGKKRLGTGWLILIIAAGLLLLAFIIFIAAYGGGGY